MQKKFKKNRHSFKDWETLCYIKAEQGKTCFAQSIPVLQAPKSLKEIPQDYLSVLDPDENIKMKLV